MRIKNNCVLRVEQLEDRLTPSPVSLNSSLVVPTDSSSITPQASVTGDPTIGPFAANTANAPVSLCS
jgi:hypothetical protein